MTQKAVLRISLSLSAAAVVGASLFSVPSIAEAGPGRARLSTDLTERLKNRQAATVIVAGTESELVEIAARHGANVKKMLRGAAVLEVSADQLETLSTDPAVSHLSGDVPVRRTMAVTAQTVGADQVWMKSGVTARGHSGSGIGVAVIDSGVATTHPSLRNKVVASFDFTASSGLPDDSGHGTHVASIIAGRDDDYAGVAPGAHIVSLRVLSADGSGDTSDVIAALDWTVENRHRYNLKVVNLSLGHPVFESYVDDPLCQAVQRATDAGLLVVTAAGNFGKTLEGRPILGGIISPANSPAALTVGAVNARGTVPRSDDVMATYSSRGPTLFDGLLKPELVAPGNRIVAAAAPGAALPAAFPDRVIWRGRATTWR